MLVNKHPTHTGIDECVVASNKVVSARKEAHVEMSKMEVEDKGG